MAGEENLPETTILDGENVRNLSLDSNSSSEHDEEQQIRRDVLGDKVHSKKYVMLYNSIQFLLKLQRTKWKKEWEEQFVTMWDMTREKEVCDFLLQWNFPHLLAQIVDIYHYECRFTEILMGILSNIAFVLQEDMVFSSDDMPIVFNLFYYNNNVSVLTQIFKFFCQVWRNTNIDIVYEEYEFCNRVLFILADNLNCELLYEMLSCLPSMCDDIEFSEFMIDEDPFFLKHCVTAYKHVYTDIDEQRDDGAIFTLRQYNCFHNLMWIINNVTKSAPSNQLKAACALASESLLKETLTVYIFLSRDQETIESLPKSEALFVSLLAFLSEVHPVSYQDNLFKSLLKIVINSSRSELPQNSLLDLVLYFICSTENYGQLKSDCLEVGKRRTLRILENFAEIKNEWNFFNKVLCAQNLHRLNRDLKELLNK